MVSWRNQSPNPGPDSSSNYLCVGEKPGLGLLRACFDCAGEHARGEEGRLQIHIRYRLVTIQLGN
jgi:hypothetical protein